VALETLIAVKNSFCFFRGCGVGVVTGAAPEFALAGDRAVAGGEFFGVALDFEKGVVGVFSGDVDGENILHCHAGAVVGDLFAGVGDAGFAA
jgi:hypothetical protein